MTKQDSYALLDSGEGRKLEAFGPHILERQAPQALWKPARGPHAWAQAAAIHRRHQEGGGHWEFKSPLPESWMVQHGGLKLELRPTPFGHVGFFPEQAACWAWLRRVLREGPRRAAPRILNLFGYSGGSSLVLAGEGARVCHVDASRGMVDQAARNARRNGLAEHPLRWIVEDCTRFLKREERRGRCYDGVVLDPPSFGRGPRKEVFKIEQHLLPLLQQVRAVLAPDPLLVLITCHTPAMTPLLLENLLLETLLPETSSLERGELSLTPDGSGPPLPSGIYCRYARP